MKVLAPLSSPKPYAPQAKLASKTNHARSGHLFVNGERVKNSKNFLKMLKSVFKPVLNKKGRALLQQLVKKFSKHPTKHLEFIAFDRFSQIPYFDRENGMLSQDPFTTGINCLDYKNTGYSGFSIGKGLLTSWNGIVSREDLKVAPETKHTKYLLKRLDKSEKMGHEEFLVVAQKLINGESI
jgi:hypothetical protein